MMTPHQLQASQRAQMERWFELANKSLDEAGKFFELNFSVCQDTLQDMAHCCLSACDVRDMSGALNWQNAAFKPLAERSAEYGARLMGWASGLGREFGRSSENQWQTLSQPMNWASSQHSVVLNSGPETAFGYLRDTMKAFDSVWVSVRQNLQQSQQAAQMNALSAASRERKAR